MKKQEKRLKRLQAVADMVVEKLEVKVAALEPLEINPQALKHITGVMKDLKDIQSAGTDTEDTGKITVVFTGELEEFSG